MGVWGNCSHFLCLSELGWLLLQVELFQTAAAPDYINAMHCLILINNPSEVSKMIISLLSKKEDPLNDLAYNIGMVLKVCASP